MQIKRSSDLHAALGKPVRIEVTSDDGDEEIIAGILRGWRTRGDKFQLFIVGYQYPITVNLGDRWELQTLSVDPLMTVWS